MAAPTDEDAFAVNMGTAGSTNDTSSSNLEAGLEAGQVQHQPHESIDNELAEDHVYTVKFTFAVYTDTIKSRVDNFINNMLNGQDIGIVFFKAQPFYRSYRGNRGETNDHGSCLIEFHLFSIECLNQDVYKTIHEYASTYLNPDDPHNKLEDLHHDVLIRHKTQLRKPVYTEDSKDFPDNPTSLCQLPWSFCRKCIDWWLILPRVQWDVFALLYQLYTFDITHQGFFPKFIHFFTIPVNVALSMMFLAQFKLGKLDETSLYASEFVFDINGSLILMLLLVLLYSVMGLVRRCPTWGFATAFFVFLLWGAGNCMYVKFSYETLECYGGNESNDVHTGPKWYNPVLHPYNPIMWSYVVSFIQASSHMFVPQLPPFITGVTHWESVYVFLFKNKGAKACCWRILALCSFPVTSVAVAWFSWPHLIGTQVFYIMAGIGYRHSYFSKYMLITQKAELSGDPNVARFPDSFHDLTEACETENHKHHCLIKLKKHGLLEDGKKYSPRDAFKELASLHIYQRYFHSHQTAGDTLDDDSADAHFMHYKALSSTN